MSIELEIGANTNDPLTLDETEIKSLNPVKTHTGVGDFSASIAGNRSVEEYAQRQDRVNIKSDGITFFTGYLLKVSHNTQRGTTRLQGRGIGKKLQETRPDYGSLGGSITYTNIALEDAIDNYWGRTPFSATVTDQTTSLVSEDDQLASIDTTTEWQNNTSISNTDRVIIDNGKLKLAQSAFINDVSGSATSVNYSGGDARDLQNPNDNETFNITVEYESSYTVATRTEVTEDEDYLEYDVFVDGQNIGPGQPSDTLGWEDLASTTLSPGSHSVRIEVVDISGFSPDKTALDVIAVYDDNLTFNFDNSVHTNGGYLDSPREYKEATVTTQEYTTSLNIAEADLTTTYNDLTGSQQLGVTFDGGNSFTRASNTNSLTATNSDASRTVEFEFTLSGYPQSGTNPQSATPRYGYKGQTVDSAELLVDINDLVVVDELELSKNHFNNLQTLHEYGDFIFAIEHDSGSVGNLTVNSFQRGDETRTLPSLTDNDINKTPKVDSSQYYNSIFVQGALVSGSRPTAEAKDSTAISNDRGEISPGVLRDLDVLTEGGAEFRAQSLLDKAQKNSALRGQKVTPAVDLSPGYAYAVDFGDGLTEFTAEEVSISKGTDRAETTLDFIPRSDISQDIAELRRNARKTEDQV